MKRVTKATGPLKKTPLDVERDAILKSEDITLGYVRAGGAWKEVRGPATLSGRGPDLTGTHLQDIVDPAPPSPSTYYGGKDDPYEVWKVLRAWKLGHWQCSAIEYIRRAGLKDAGKYVEDLEKAVACLQDEIEAAKRGETP